ncbi:glycosyltransferase family 2 protein [Leptothoe sp. LEGE 181152]|nr:glycosyltransferase family 2 protein [Leptothoe sp. LEGE 181152]
MPLLSICIPAYNRPEWLKRAILSILTTPIEQQPQVELIVSDDSTIPACKQIVDELIVNWHGKHHYCQNTPSLGMAGNWNHCIQIASGEYVLILHDDDYLEAEAPGKILETLQQHPNESALLFGVNVVTSKQNIQKQQIFQSQKRLTSEEALEKLLTNSSFIRFPGIVLNRQVFQRTGYFKETIGGIADIDLWIRICQQYGLLCIPITTANYTVHGNALTMQMFNTQVLNGIENLFKNVEAQQWLPKSTLKKCKTNYFHQFILAGTVRHLKRWDAKSASNTFKLLNQLNVENKHLKLKWKILKITLKIILNPPKIFIFGQQSNEV